MSLLLLLGAASPSLALGASQCSWGPSYWCANIQQVMDLLKDENILLLI